MRTRSLVVAMALAFAMTAWGDDKIGNSKAPEVFKKSAAEIAKKKGFHVVEQFTPPGGGRRGGGGGGGGNGDMGRAPTDTVFEGIVKKDFAALAGAAEVYFKGPLALTRTAKGAYVEPKDLPEEDALVAGAARNPAMILADLWRFGAASAFIADEKLGERECKIAETWADAATTEQHLKDVAKQVRIPRQFGPIDVMMFVDKKKSSSSYKVWVGKEDLLFHKVEWTVVIAIDKTKVPGGFADRWPDRYEAKYVIEINDYDKDLDYEPPKEIRAKFGLK